MARKGTVEMAKVIALKRLRNRARLEAAIRVDLLLNELEDEFVTEFDRRVSAGEAYELTSYETWVVDAIDQRFSALPSVA
jgi:hypothetical protein